VCVCVCVCVFSCFFLPRGFEDTYYISEHPVANTENSTAALFCLFWTISVNYFWLTSILRHWPLTSKDSFACILSKYFVVDTEEPKKGLGFLELGSSKQICLSIATPLSSPFRLNMKYTLRTLLRFVYRY